MVNDTFISAFTIGQEKRSWESFICSPNSDSFVCPPHLPPSLLNLFNDGLNWSLLFITPASFRSFSRMGAWGSVWIWVKGKGVPFVKKTFFPLCEYGTNFYLCLYTLVSLPHFLDEIRVNGHASLKATTHRSRRGQRCTIISASCSSCHGAPW